MAPFVRAFSVLGAQCSTYPSPSLCIRSQAPHNVLLSKVRETDHSAKFKKATRVQLLGDVGRDDIGLRSELLEDKQKPVKTIM